MTVWGHTDARGRAWTVAALVGFLRRGPGHPRSSHDDFVVSASQKLTSVKLFPSEVQRSGSQIDELTIFGRIPEVCGIQSRQELGVVTPVLLRASRTPRAGSALKSLL